jgi:DNA invertase Pin-like site-specific DNA recombinase
MNTAQKVVAYIRVSTVGQVEDGVSLDAQRAKIAAWCSLNDAELVAVFEDAGLSGASMTKRNGLHAALKATGKGMALVCYSMSRLARSTRDMLAIAEQLDAKHADLVSLTEKIDTTTASGRMVFKMLAVLAD